MDILPVTELTRLQAYQLVQEVAYDHDFAWLPADPIEELVPLLRGEVEAGALSVLFLAVEDEVPVGNLLVRLTTLDNLESASLDLTVHPEHRRQGVGRALLADGIAEVRRRGRRRVFLQVPSDLDGSPPAAQGLLEEVGAKPVLVDVRRLLDLGAHPVATPPAAPSGYRVVQWLDRCPEDLVAGMAYLTGRMTLDAPMGEMDYEQERWDAARYRAKEAVVDAQGRTRLVTAVVHEPTGAVAGMTDIGVSRTKPQIAYQWETIVDPDHRGHRLGLVLKSWNHQLLVQRVPAARVINTWNAESNTFMVKINDELGFRPVELWTEWQLDL